MRASLSWLFLACLLVTTQAGDPRLQTIVPSEGTLSPGFSPDVYNYRVVLPSTSVAISISYSPVHSNSTVVESESSSFLYFGSRNNKTLLVTTADFDSTATYVVHITRLWPLDLQLESLNITSTHTIVPTSFSPSIDAYYLTVPDHTVGTIRFSVKLQNASATLVIAGRAAQSDVQDTYNLQYLNTSIPILVSIDGRNHTTIFTVFRPLFPNALQSLVVSPINSLSPSFFPGTRDYTLFIPYAIDKLTFASVPVSTNTSLSVFFGSTRIDGGTATLPIATGSQNRVIILGQDQDGSDSVFYQVVVTRFDQIVNASDATLFALSTATNEVDQPLSPAFDPQHVQYTVTVAVQVELTNFTVVPAENFALVNITAPVYCTVDIRQSFVPFIFQVAGLRGGNNPVELLLTAPNGRNQIVYTITVFRTPSSDTSLRSLGVAPPSTLFPAFDKALDFYEIRIPNAFSGATFNMSADDLAAKMELFGPFDPLPSSQGTTSLRLTSNPITNFTIDHAEPVSVDNVSLVPASFTVKITAPNGRQTRTLTVTLSRAQPPSFLANISRIIEPFNASDPINRTVLLNFSPNTFFYSVDVPFEQTSVSFFFSGGVNNPTSYLEVNGQRYDAGEDPGFSLPLHCAIWPCVRTMEVVVYNSDARETISYYVNVTRNRPTILPCSRFEFCGGNEGNRNGECIGLPPQDFCLCFEGYKNENCSELAGQVVFVGQAASIGAMSVATVAAGVQYSFGGSGLAYTMLPFVMFLQKWGLPITHNADLKELIGPFRPLRALQLSGAASAADETTLGNGFFSVGHGLGFKIALLIILVISAKVLWNKVLVTPCFITEYRAGHFTYLFLLLFLPLVESLSDVALPTGLTLVLWVVLEVLLVLWVIYEVLPHCTDDAMSFLMTGEGWQGWVDGQSWTYGDSCYTFSMKWLRSRCNNRCINWEDWEVTGLMCGIFPDRQAAEERFVSLKGKNEEGGDVGEEEEDEEEEQGTTGATDAASAARLALADDISVSLSDSDSFTTLSSESSGGSKYSVNLPKRKEEVVEDPSPIYKELGTDDVWLAFPYKHMFDRVVRYKELTPVQRGAKSEVALFVHWMRVNAAHLFQFIELAHLVTFVCVAVGFDGATQFHLLCAVIITYVFWMVVLQPFKLGSFAASLLMTGTLLTQLIIFSLILTDRKRVGMLWYLIGLQTLVLPVRFYVLRRYTRMDEWGLHIKAARDRIRARELKEIEKEVVEELSVHESMFNDRAPSVVSRASSRRQSVHFDADAAYAEIMQTKQDEEFLARYHRDYDHVNQEQAVRQLAASHVVEPKVNPNISKKAKTTHTLMQAMTVAQNAVQRSSSMAPADDATAQAGTAGADSADHQDDNPRSQTTSESEPSVTESAANNDDDNLRPTYYAPAPQRTSSHVALDVMDDEEEDLPF